MSGGAPRIDWKRYALKLALVAAERSEDPFLKWEPASLGQTTVSRVSDITERPRG